MTIKNRESELERLKAFGTMFKMLVPFLKNLIITLYWMTQISQIIIIDLESIIKYQRLAMNNWI